MKSRARAPSGPEGPHRRRSCQARSRPAPSPQPVLLHSPRAEALGHGHHQERSREHRRGARSRSRGPTRSWSSTRRAPTTRSRIARQFTDRVVVRPGRATSAQKNFAASLAAHDWILSLDADERVTPALADEIRAAARRGSAACARYRMPRVTWHLGRWIRSTDWYPDYQLRLYDRRAAQWTGAVRPRGGGGGRHASGACAASCSTIAYRDIADHLETIDRYTTLAARADAARAAAAPACCSSPAIRRWPFCATTSLRGGFRDGVAGLHHLGAERVLRVPEVREAVGAAARRHAAPTTTRALDRRPPSTPATVEPHRARRCSPSTSTPRAPGAAARTRCC